LAILWRTLRLCGEWILFGLEIAARSGLISPARLERLATENDRILAIIVFPINTAKRKHPK
jgi:hypothetical protein